MNTYQINNALRVRFQALGGQSGIADLQMVVTKPDNTDLTAINFTELSNGLYEGFFTPDVKGRWWVRVISITNPENNFSQAYFVGDQDGSLQVILMDANGDSADITASGRLKISQEPPSPPPNTTPVIRTNYEEISGEADNVWVIPSGETVVLQRFSAGAEPDNNGSVMELWYDPNGDGTSMVIIDAIFVNGYSGQHDLNETYIGDGTKAIRVRQKRLGGGGVLLFMRWEGYY